MKNDVQNEIKKVKLDKFYWEKQKTEHLIAKKTKHNKSLTLVLYQT